MLVDNKKHLHKSSTVILSVILVVLSLLEIVQPYLATLQPVIDAGWFPWISAGMGIAIGIGRYIKQQSVHETSKDAAIEDNSNGLDS